MNYIELLYIIDNDGNERELFFCRVENLSKISTKDLRAKIEKGFKIIRKLNGICVQIFVVDKVKINRDRIFLIEIHEF
ncbi:MULTISPECIES: hypothetical protein [Acinetobacter]|uniref:hypothetical protein n=1 Tax=Acinetobacter TaxID=469 RepID=UPI000D00493D|nr:hypothetical protein [Acinetobacter sp. MYb10]QLD60331.1 hypothetical protein CQZ96_003245 [Acinetobacter sp. MYb10]